LSVQATSEKVKLIPWAIAHGIFLFEEFQIAVLLLLCLIGSFPYLIGKNEGSMFRVGGAG